jgi:hypothetical protein
MWRVERRGRAGYSSTRIAKDVVDKSNLMDPH